MPTDWNAVRKDFPVLNKWLYLDHAAAGPVPRPVYEQGAACLKEYHTLSDLCFDRWIQRREEVRGKIARLIGAHKDEIGFTHNTSEGMNIIADHLRDAPEVVSATLEFPSSTVPWIYRGKRIRWVSSRMGLLRPEDYQRRMGKSGVLLSSFVQFGNGFRQDLNAMGRIKGRHRFVVNATQGLNVFELDVCRSRIDALATNSYKWFLGGYGGGFVYLSRELLRRGRPAHAGWRSVRLAVLYGNKDFTLREDAARVELGCPSFLNIIMMGAILDYNAALGRKAIARRVLDLGAELIEGLQKLGLKIASPLEEKHRSGIVVFEHKQPAPLAKALMKRRVFVSPRGVGIRVAPHYYNNSADIQKFLRILKGLL